MLRDQSSSRSPKYATGDQHDTYGHRVGLNTAISELVHARQLRIRGNTTVWSTFSASVRALHGLAGQEIPKQLDVNLEDDCPPTPDRPLTMNCESGRLVYTRHQRPITTRTDLLICTF